MDLNDQFAAYENQIRDLNMKLHAEKKKRMFFLRRVTVAYSLSVALLVLVAAIALAV